MRNFEPHDTPNEDQAWNDEIQFFDLDPSRASTRQRRMLTLLSTPIVWRKARWWMTAGVVVAGLLLLLFQAGYRAFPFAPTPVPNALRPQSVELPSSVLLTTPQIVYTLDDDGNLNALKTQNGNLFWRYHPPLLISRGIQVVDDTAYFIADNERQGDIYALRVADGHLLWHHPLTSTIPTWFTVEKGMVYVAAQDGMLYALHAQGGGLAWQYKGSPSAVSEPFIYLVDDILYTCSQSEKHFVALRASDGRVLWKRDTPFAQVFLNAVSGITYIGAGDGSISAFNAQNGSMLWRAASSTTMLAMNFSFAAAGDIAYLITQNGTLDARRAQNGALLWSFSPGYPIWGRLLLSGHTLYVGAYDGTIYTLRDNGTLLWHYITKQPVSLITASADQLFIQDTSSGDSIYVLRARDGSLLWNRQMGQATYLQSGAFLLVGHVLYVTTVDGTINALRESDGHLLWFKRILRLPQLQDGVLYAAGAEGGINALWAYTGSLRWHAHA